eukprot:scaffold6613_cov111-Isochrysis_galbana.AAC.4
MEATVPMSIQRRTENSLGFGTSHIAAVVSPPSSVSQPDNMSIPTAEAVQPVPFRPRPRWTGRVGGPARGLAHVFFLPLSSRPRHRLPLAPRSARRDAGHAQVIGPAPPAPESGGRRAACTICRSCTMPAAVAGRKYGRRWWRSRRGVWPSALS